MSAARCALALCLLITPVIAGCGLRGDLRTPPPIIGDDNRTAEEKAEAEKAEQIREERRARKRNN